MEGAIDLVRCTVGLEVVSGDDDRGSPPKAMTFAAKCDVFRHKGETGKAIEVNPVTESAVLREISTYLCYLHSPPKFTQILLCIGPLRS